MRAATPLEILIDRYDLPRKTEQITIATDWATGLQIGTAWTQDGAGHIFHISSIVEPCCICKPGDVTVSFEP